MANYAATKDQPPGLPHSYLEKDEQVRKLQRLLEGWRMALLTLKSVILWEQQWHPAAIFISISILYLLVWILDLNTLATFAVVALLLNFVDFIVPFVSKLVCGPSAWTGQHEKKFHEICNSIVVQYNKLFQNIMTFYSMRESSPTVYYVISISMLIILTWIASSINNIFLLYILTTVMLLWPGLARTGLFNSLLSLFNMAPKVLKSE